MAHNLDAKLEAFRRTHKPVRTIVGGARWSYIVSGSGPHTLLFLPGAPGIAEMAFPYILVLERHYRVVAPSYPATVGSLEQLLGGLEAILDAESGAPVHLIGASYSGLVAQCLLQRAPGRFRTLLIGDTGVSRPERATALEALAAALSRLPPAALRAVVSAILRNVLWGDTPAHRFWQGYFRGIVLELTGRELANRVRVMVEMDRHGPAPHAPWHWHGPTLLMETVHDPLFSPAERAALRARFPHAERHAFHSRGHITALTRAPEYVAVMANFLARHSLLAEQLVK